MIYGPRAFPALARNREARFVGGCLVSACAVALSAPYALAALHSGSQTMLTVAAEVIGMNFGRVG